VANVDLGIRHLDAKGGEATESGSEVCAGRSRSHDEVTLEADAVDRGAGSLDGADELDDPVLRGVSNFLLQLY
jgi:hypothetical protein